MFKLLVVLFASLIIFSCTKKVDKKPLNIKRIGSLNYTEETSDDSSLLAQFDDIKITFDEVHKKSRVIQEIHQQEESLYSALLYRMAIKKIDQKIENKEELKETYSLIVYTAEPKEGIENLIKRLKLNPTDKISVTFAEPSEAQKQTKTIANFDGEDMLYSSLDKNHVAYIELQTKKNDEYLRQVKGILTRRMLFSEAKKNNLSVQDFIGKNVVTQDVSVNDQEVIEFMRSKNVVDQEMTEQLTKSFKNILLEKKRNEIIGSYIKNNIAKKPFQFYIKSPDLNFEVKTDWSPILGSETASHSIYMFTNPNCSACATVEKNVSNALASNDYDVKLHTFYFYPEWDREARLFSEATMCAYLEDKSKFWEFHSLVSQADSKVTEGNLYEFAAQLNLNEQEFKSCVLQRKTKDIVDYHLKYTDYLGLNSQPTLVVKGKIYPGTISTEKLVQLFGNDFVKKQKPGLLTRIINYIKNIFA